MLGLFKASAPPHQPPAGAQTPQGQVQHAASDPDLVSKALSGRLTLTPALSDAMLSRAAGASSPAPALAAPGSPRTTRRRSSSSGGSSSGSAAADTPLSSGAQDTPQSDKEGGAPRGRLPSHDAGDGAHPASPPAGAAGGADAARPAQEAGREQPVEPAPPAPAAAPSPARSPAPGSTTPTAAAPAATAMPAGELSLLQAQLCAVNERAAALEFHLRAKASEAASLEPYRRRAQELEALYALSAAELSRAQEQHAAAQQAAMAQIKAQQLRILMLEEQLRIAAAGSEELHTALLQQQLAQVQAAAAAQQAQAQAAAAAAAAAAAGPLHRAGSAAGVPALGGAVSGAFDGGHRLGALMERQASMPNPATAAMSDFSRDAEVWSLRGGAGSSSSAAGRGAPGRAASLALPLPLPPGAGGAAMGGDGWGVAASASGGFAAASSAAPLALPPLSTASSAAWDAGALLMASRQQSLLDAAAAAGGGGAPHDLISDRADAQRLAGLLPFDLDSLGSGDALAPPSLAVHASPLPPPALPPAGRGGAGGAGGARSAAMKAAAAQKQAAVAAAAHLQMLAEQANDPLLRRWSEAWVGDAADVSAVAADQNPLAAALKRFSSAPSSALAAASAAPPALPPGAAALYGAAAAAAAACAAARGRASSAAGDDRDAELDAAAQNLRLRSKRDATPNTCVYVGFLGWWVSEKELEACFAPHGKLVSVRLLISKKSRRSREQAFVEFSDIPSAQAAIDAMDGLDAPALVKQPGCGGLVVRFADRKKEEEI